MAGVSSRLRKGRSEPHFPLTHVEFLNMTIKAMMTTTFCLTPYFGLPATLEMWLQPWREFYNGGEFLYLSLCIAAKKL
jgi:hypothetical protein